MKSPKLLKSYRGRPCVICESPTSTAAHIQSKGAGGSDEDWNLLALCFQCHRFQHDRGWETMLDRFPRLLPILESKGWRLVEEFGRKRLKRI